MKTGAFLIVFYLSGFLNLLAHPVHVTITNMDVLADSGRIEYSIRLYYDDFQALINHNYNTLIDFETRNRLTSKEQEAILDYIGASFQLIDEKNDILATDFTGWKKEDHMVWLVFCARLEPGLEEIRLKNTLLLDVFDDQANLVIIQQNGKEWGLEFDKRRTIQSIQI